MNWKHTDHAWERRNKDPLGPHAVALFFVSSDGGKPPQPVLSTATRLFLAGDEFTNLPLLLHDFDQAMGRLLASGGNVFKLTDRAEPMSPYAIYVGAGVSSLDTPAGTWSEVLRQRPPGSMNVPGRCYARLADGTTMLLDRGGRDQFGKFDIRCNADVAEFPNRWRRDDALPTMPGTIPIWERLDALNRTIIEGMPR